MAILRSDSQAPDDNSSRVKAFNIRSPNMDLLRPFNSYSRNADYLSNIIGNMMSAAEVTGELPVF